MQNILRNVPYSKYLKAVQQLLDEVVNVHKALKQHERKKDRVGDCVEADRASIDGTSASPAAGQDSTSNGPNELSASEKHELQNKMAKLLSMLDEVRILQLSTSM